MVTPLRKGMSAFWEGMNSANDAAIATMGELARLGDADVMVVVDVMTVEDAISAGGRKMLLGCQMLVPSGVDLEDGMMVRVRGMDGRVNSWAILSPNGHRMVQVGPVNRWSGEIPGA